MNEIEIKIKCKSFIGSYIWYIVTTNKHILFNKNPDLLLTKIFLYHETLFPRAHLKIRKI